MSVAAPGAYAPLVDRWGPFERCAKRLPEGAVAIVDRRVARLHPHVPAALRERRPARVFLLHAGEAIKDVAIARTLLAQLVEVPRTTTFVAVGGGTIGDLATVVAHLHKRGAPLIHVPTTLLAAVDSSVGGKGAVDVTSVRARFKNAAGVFHYPRESWLCPELFGTLSPRQRREGAIEAWKMAVCLSPSLWRSLQARRVPERALIREARRLKADVCRRDPYEQAGLRRVLNFGHTFGHALEGLSAFELSHGDAVGLGMLCALDVGVAMGVTPAKVAAEVEAALTAGVLAFGRAELARWLRRARDGALSRLLRGDKKGVRPDALTMVLLERVGRWRIAQVPHARWRVLARAWREGARP